MKALFANKIEIFRFCSQPEKNKQTKNPLGSTKPPFLFNPNGHLHFWQLFKNMKSSTLLCESLCKLLAVFSYQHIALMKTLPGIICRCFSVLRPQKKCHKNQVSLIKQDMVCFPNWSFPSSEGRYVSVSACLAGRSPWIHGQHPGHLGWWWKPY